MCMALNLTIIEFNSVLSIIFKRADEWTGQMRGSASIHDNTLNISEWRSCSTPSELAQFSSFCLLLLSFDYGFLRNHISGLSEPFRRQDDTICPKQTRYTRTRYGCFGSMQALPKAHLFRFSSEVYYACFFFPSDSSDLHLGSQSRYQDPIRRVQRCKFVLNSSQNPHTAFIPHQREIHV